jgi:hypothetical protein
VTRPNQYDLSAQAGRVKCKLAVLQRVLEQSGPSESPSIRHQPPLFHSPSVSCLPSLRSFPPRLPFCPPYSRIPRVRRKLMGSRILFDLTSCIQRVSCDAPALVEVHSLTKLSCLSRDLFGHMREVDHAYTAAHITIGCENHNTRGTYFLRPD